MLKTIKKKTQKWFRNEFQNIQMDYDAPKCPSCKTLQSIDKIIMNNNPNNRYQGQLQYMEIEIMTICSDVSCESGFEQTNKFKLYNPETHKIRKIK